MVVAVLFTAGCILPVWSRFHLSGAREFSRVWFWIPAAYFAALAWLNCNSIARWESDDETGKQRTDGRSCGRAGQRAESFAALGIALVGLLLAIVAGGFHPRVTTLLIAGAASALLLALLDRLRLRMTALALRVAADLVLLTPLVLLLK
jgi:hypothetical protein